MRRTGRLGTAVLLCTLGVGVSGAGAQEASEGTVAPAADPWEPLRLLEGSWEGTIDGRLGQGIGVRRYEFALEDRYVVARHTSVRPPQEKSPKGDHHRELAIYSFDRERKTLVLREFMSEGYVLRYACDVAPKRFVCTTEAVENGPGMKARLTVEIADRYRFREIFELASPGQELEVYFTNDWTRVPDLKD
jgi:hypothetical protein